MKSFFATARSKLKIAAAAAPAVPKKRTLSFSDNEAWPVLTEEEVQSNQELAGGVNRLILIGKVVQKLTLDIEHFLGVVQQLCVEHIKMADGFRVIFGKSAEDEDETLLYTSACSALANSVRGDCEKKLRQFVLKKLLKKATLINRLRDRVSSWQVSHTVFVDTLSRARRRHQKGGSISNELDPNDVSQIRLAEGELESTSRSLLLEIDDLHRSRFHWIREIATSFKHIQSEFYAAAGSTLRSGCSAPAPWSGENDVENNESMTAAAAKALLARNHEELMTSCLERHDKVRRHMCSYLASGDVARCCLVWRSGAGVLWSWYVRDRLRIDAALWRQLVRQSFVRSRLASVCYGVSRVHGLDQVVATWLASGLVAKGGGAEEVEVEVEGKKGEELKEGPLPLVNPTECSQWYASILKQANAYEQQHCCPHTNEETSGVVVDGSMEEDMILKSFHAIEVDIRRTTSRKRTGRSKRGGALHGSTVEYSTKDSSTESLESLVASALGQTERERAASRDSSAGRNSRLSVGSEIGEVVEGDDEEGEDRKEEDRKEEDRREEDRKEEDRKEEERIQRVLRAYSFCDVKLRYVQGMNFIVQALFDGGRDGDDELMKEMDAFGMLVSIMNTHGLRDVYENHLFGLKRCFYQLDILSTDHFPSLLQHFKECNVTTSMYATSWFLTLFTNFDCLSPAYAFKVFNIFLIEGWTFIYQVSLAILESLQSKLLGSDFEAILRILQDPQPIIMSMYPHPNDLVRASDCYVVTDVMLRESERSFEESMHG